MSVPELTESQNPRQMIDFPVSCAEPNLVYDHASVNHSAKEYVNGMAHTNGIESVWAVLKRGFYGVYHSFSEKHLQRYVDEFSFRLNEGNVKNHTMSRIDSLLAKSVGVRIMYKELIESV